MEFRRTVTMTQYARQQQREGKGGMIQESSTEACMLPYVKQTTSASWIHEAWHSKPVLWDNPEGWGGEGSEGFRTGDTCIPVADSCRRMAGPPWCSEMIVLQIK